MVHAQTADTTGEADVAHKRTPATSEMSTIYDVVCIGFGIKGLAFATALADKNRSKKVLILEREVKFDADRGFTSNDHPSGSGFLRDLITLQNPRSEFTFINFLHESHLLLGFVNTSEMNPSRTLVARYMAWVTEKIQQLNWLAYGKDALQVRPIRSTQQDCVAGWIVNVRDCNTRSMLSIKTQRLVITTGASEQLPTSFSSAAHHHQALLIREAAIALDRIRAATKPLHIAVAGANQEAVELFNALQSMQSAHRVTMMFPGSALRVEDNTPFVQDMIDGGSGQLNHLPPEMRQKLLATRVASTYPTVNLATLEHLYSALYAQYLHEPDETKHHFRLRPLTEIVRAEPNGNLVQLRTKNTRSSVESQACEDFDLVLSTGERRSATSEALLGSIIEMLGDAKDVNVDSEYSVNFRRGALVPGCGLWIIGSLVDQNIRRDNFSVLSATAHRAVQSVLEQIKRAQDGPKDSQKLAML